jgi:hypothetical protein
LESVPRGFNRILYVLRDILASQAENAGPVVVGCWGIVLFNKINEGVVETGNGTS